MAGGVVVDAALVEAEALGAGVHGDRHGPLCEEGLPQALLKALHARHHPLQCTTSIQKPSGCIDDITGFTAHALAMHRMRAP